MNTFQRVVGNLVARDKIIAAALEIYQSIRSQDFEVIGADVAERVIGGRHQICIAVESIVQNDHVIIGWSWAENAHTSGHAYSIGSVCRKVVGFPCIYVWPTPYVKVAMANDTIANVILNAYRIVAVQELAISDEDIKKILQERFDDRNNFDNLLIERAQKILQA